MKCYSASVFAILGLFILSACTSSETPNTNRSRVYVASLEENWNQIEAQALTWHSDAYLTGVILPIIVDYPRSGQALLFAFYFSAADNRKMLMVTVKENGEIDVEVSELADRLDDPPILREDWRVDSVDALTSMLNSSDADALISNPETQCSSLTLEKRRGAIERTTVWRILVHDCGISEYLRNGYIDASSGEQLK